MPGLPTLNPPATQRRYRNRTGWPTARPSTSFSGTASGENTPGGDLVSDNPTRGTYAGLSSEDAYPFAALLDYLATELPHLDPDVRRLAIDGCRLMLSEPNT